MYSNSLSIKQLVQFFVHSDSSKYATFIFNTFDRDKSGQISFDVKIF